MKITDAFVAEHQALSAQLDELSLLAGVDRHADRGAGPADARHSPGDTWRSPEPFAAAVRRHAQLEDELLLGQLEPQLGDGGPVAVMRAEHQEIQALLADLCAAPDSPAARAPAAALVSLAREHFAKEEQVLFPMAEQLLGEDVLAELGQRHAARMAGR